MDRRLFIKSTLLAPGVSLIPGCCLIPRPNINCLYDSFIPAQQEFLVDSHAHIFNGSDLQVAKFISQVELGCATGEERTEWRLLRELAGDILQLIVWEIAPNAKDELALISRFGECGTDTTKMDFSFKQLRDQQFNIARKQVEQAVKTLQIANRRLVSGVSHAVVLASFPYSYDELYKDSGVKIKLGNELYDLRQVWRFVVEMFQFRYVSFYNYLATYSREKIKPDLVLTHIVDYDWPLNKGGKTKSDLVSQVLLMSALVRKSKGLLQYFVPYCPFRHVAFLKNPKSTFDPLTLIREAVFDQGALGVKIYPPMGFSLYGNTEVENEFPDMWQKQKHLPEIFRQKGMGADLDSALDVFYTFCEEHSITIMAHSNPSNLASCDFKVMFQSKYWSSLFNKYKSLKINFGHFAGFGDMTSVADSQSNWQEIADVITQQNVVGRGFADLGYSSGVLSNQHAMIKALAELLNDRPGMIDSLNYATDWKMLVLEKDSPNYLKSFLSILNNQKFNSAVREKVLGGNASNFLGLDKTDKNRVRLEQFFLAGEQPHWFVKT